MLADALTILAAAGLLAAATWVGYIAGRDAAERAAQSTVSSQRAKIRRLERDLFLAYEENRALRRRQVPHD